MVSVGEILIVHPVWTIFVVLITSKSVDSLSSDMSLKNIHAVKFVPDWKARKEFDPAPIVPVLLIVNELDTISALGELLVLDPSDFIELAFNTRLKFPLTEAVGIAVTLII